MKEKKIGELTVSVEMQGYEEIKFKLNDIESQLDRIIEKQKSIKFQAKETSADDILKALGKIKKI